MKKPVKHKTFLLMMLCFFILFACASVAVIVLDMRGLLIPTASAEPTPIPTAVPTPTPSPSPTPTQTPIPTPTPTPYDPPEELLAAVEVNPHVIGWLEIPETDIRYPILLHPTEDNHYLNITIDGGYGYPGSVYTNKMEGKDFDTFNTVLYGHNMADGTYFGSLKNYHDKDFLDRHREIDIYTPTEKHSYDVFAVVTYDDRYITDMYDDKKEDDRTAYLRSLEDFGAEISDIDRLTKEGRILTLSTCIGGMPYNRLLIVAAERTPDMPVSGAPAKN